MEKFLILSATGPWYEFFYNLALFVALGVLIFEGWKRKFPMLKWVLLLIISRILFIAGTKIVTIPGYDWMLLFTQFRLPEAPGKSLLGGLLFGGAGLLAGCYFLKFKRNITDAFAIVLPLGIAIQRMGCFLTGCCFGKTCSLPWAVQYPVNTLPHYHQFNDQLISYPDALSLPVHPVQLYEMGGMLAALFLLFYFRKKLKRDGSLFLFSLILIFTVRFVTEFFRDAHAHAIGGEMTGLLNTTQIFLIPVILLVFFILRFREKHISTGFQTISGKDIPLTPAFLLFFLLALVFFTLKNWFTFPERVALILTFLVAFGIFGFQFIGQFYRAPYKWAYLAGFVLPFFLMAQTLPYSSSDSVYVKKYKSLKFGIATGKFENSHNIGTGDGCDRVSQTEYFKQKYTVAAAALEFTEEQPIARTEFTYGAKLMLGSHNETRISDNKEKNSFLVGVTPYASWESNWLGFGGGLHFGNLSFITENLQKDGSGRPESGSTFVPVYPQLYMRAGLRRWIFAEYRLADHFPSALPGFRQQLALGTGLGLDNGTNLRLGFNTDAIYFLSGRFPIENKIVLEPMVLWGKFPIYNYPDTEKYSYQFSFGLSYRFGHSEGYRSPR
ncbi:prolipoprotein diacylglyceryl transferase [Mariniphaga sp.]|uniref:prolipoprotein diacylglyceryl transferase n=1 Tax=Mariniphaga sp. TaxID=1954475 RepID=UPI003561BADC